MNRIYMDIVSSSVVSMEGYKYALVIADWECDRKLPNRLPNFRLIDCLIDCLIVRSSLIRNLGFILIGDALRDHPATPEMGTFVPNGRRHGGSANNAKSN